MLKNQSHSDIADFLIIRLLAYLEPIEEFLDLFVINIDLFTIM